MTKTDKTIENITEWTTTVCVTPIIVLTVLGAILAFGANAVANQIEACRNQKDVQR